MVWTFGLVGGCGADDAGNEAQTAAGSGVSGASSANPNTSAGSAAGLGGRGSDSSGAGGSAGPMNTAGSTSSAGASGNASAGGAAQEPGRDAGASSGDGSGVCPNWEMPAFDSLPRCNAGRCNGPATCSLFRPSVMGGVPPPSCATVLCPQGTVCIVSGLQTNCVAPCDAPGGQCVGGRCAPGEPGADALGCAPMLCTEGGVECGLVSECEPGHPQSDASGCMRIACSSDGDCPCGTCDDNLCWERPRRCFTLQFAP